jgi:anti-sigma regulatory factor (Ser/Thr protein kinase)
MTSSVDLQHVDEARAPWHGALLYRDDEEYLDGVVPFVREGLEADDVVVANLDAAKSTLVRAELGVDAEWVEFHDMRELGRNPARLIPALLDNVERHAARGRRIRVVGEPVWPGRRPAELEECDLHEALIDRVLATTASGPVLCPFDAAALPPASVEHARMTHRSLVESGRPSTSDDHDADAAAALFRRPLPAPPARTEELRFDRIRIAAVRRLVAAQALAAGLDVPRTDDLLLAASEAAGNSVRHGGGGGTVRAWTTADAVVVDIVDDGAIGDPLAGRLEPAHDLLGGRGLWIMNQLCDLVQVRSPRTGANVRLHMWRD